jgi:hypothetical protein
MGVFVMSMASDNWLTGRAYHLAHSGGYFGWSAVERELEAEGYSRAHYLLENGRIREELNAICAEARKGTYRDA